HNNDCLPPRSSACSASRIDYMPQPKARSNSAAPCCSHFAGGNKPMNATKLGIGTIALAAFVSSGTASAQPKVTGTMQRAKATSQRRIRGGGPGHGVLRQGQKCIWTKPLTIARAKSKDASDAGTADVNGSKSRDMGYNVSTMDNGDQFTVRYTGTSTMADGLP